MPALLLSKKSITRSLSKKWNSVRGNNNNNYSKTRNNISSCIIIDTCTTDDQMSNDAAPVPPLRSSPSLSTDKDERNGSTYNDGYNYCVRPSSTDEKTVPEAAVVSDTSSEDDDSDSGGEDAEKYGYGDAVPDTETKSFPKRLPTRNSIRRRSSICRQKPLPFSENNDDENLPFHPERVPRRSSIKGTCSTRARARRRASISTCTTSSIEEELARGTIQPSQVLEIRVPGRRESIKRRTSITFNEDVNVCKIQAISKVKGAVKQELWFQDVEYTQIKKKTRALIKKIDSTGTFDGKKYCTRGLEKYMECPQNRASKKCQGWDSVLMEQEIQRNQQIYDDESISGFYKQTAQENVVEATNRAQLDAEEVASFYTTDTTVVATIASDLAGAAARTRRGRRASVV